MGVWSSVFRDVGVAQDFADALTRGPVRARDGYDVFYHSVGDDGFFNLVDETVEDDPAADVRDVAARWVRNWLLAGPSTWSRPWDPEATRIVSEATLAHLASRPGVRIPSDYECYFDEVPADPELERRLAAPRP